MDLDLEEDAGSVFVKKKSWTLEVILLFPLFFLRQSGEGLRGGLIWGNSCFSIFFVIITSRGLG